MPKVVKVDPAKEASKAAAKQEKACNDLIKACKDDALSKAKKGVALLPHPPRRVRVRDLSAGCISRNGSTWG